MKAKKLFPDISFNRLWKAVHPVDNLESTDKDKSLSANMGREINNKIPFKFGIDENGNYGYIKDGADSVTPFKKLNIKLVASNTAADDPTYSNAEIGKTYMISYYSSYSSGNGKFTSITGCEVIDSLQLLSTYQYGSCYQHLNVAIVKATSSTINADVSSNGYSCWCIYQID